MLEMLHIARSGVDEEIFCAASRQLESSRGVSRGYVTHNVMAIPPVARIPQRTVLGDDMVSIAYS